MGIEITYKVFSDGEGACIDVGPWSDAPHTVCMQTIGEHNQDFYGAFSVTLSPENARDLGNALLRCADDMEREAQGLEKQFDRAVFMNHLDND